MLTTCMGHVQSEGNALWLFAYFGYWIEILLIIGIKLWRGVLTDAMKKRSPHVMREVAEHTPQPADKSFDDSASEAASSLRPSSDIGVTKAKAKARAVELPHRNFDHEVLDPKMGDDMDPKVAAMDPKMAVADEKVPAWCAQDGDVAAPSTHTMSPKKPVSRSDFFV